MTTASRRPVEVIAPVPDELGWVVASDALAFVADLERRFRAGRTAILAAREVRAAGFAAGELPDFPTATAAVREADWRIAPTPADLQDRRVEITGPAEPKMMINALNSGASVFMADFEDALSPTWSNVLTGQAALHAAVRRTLAFDGPDGKAYRLHDTIATLMVRPRGWHLVERHVLVDGEPVSASLFDAGLYLFHNARERVDRRTGPYFYLPKLEGRAEAALWDDVFTHAETVLGLPHGATRATVLIETILAAFEMDEILHALRDHAAGLNAGRWDYIFSLIKKFAGRADMVLPDRAQVTMAVPFMRAYTQLLVRTCHRRGAHAIGGMAAFIPNRRDPEVTEVALAKVTEDKEREARDGFDGTWVAHPDLVPIARDVFDRAFSTDDAAAARVNQLDRLRDDVRVGAADLLDVRIAGGRTTEAGVRTNVNVALQYLDSWLRGIGAAAIFNLMEDVATCEISRSQLWQWIRHGVALEDGRPMTADVYRAIRDEELARLGGPDTGRLADAAAILDAVVLAPEFEPFLTLVAGDRLD
ncbi:MAG TPA: malate synthase A [Candidatus Limnocylindrales bacterium]|nr:malate synthase A [Candidatus Limnocylindrales bacterium]